MFENQQPTGIRSVHNSTAWEITVLTLFVLVQRFYFFQYVGLYEIKTYSVYQALVIALLDYKIIVILTLDKEHRAQKRSN